MKGRKWKGRYGIGCKEWDWADWSLWENRCHWFTLWQNRDVYVSLVAGDCSVLFFRHCLCCECVHIQGKWLQILSLVFLCLQPMDAARNITFSSCLCRRAVLGWRHSPTSLPLTSSFNFVSQLNCCSLTHRSFKHLCAIPRNTISSPWHYGNGSNHILSLVCCIRSQDKTFCHKFVLKFRTWINQDVANMKIKSQL